MSLNIAVPSVKCVFVSCYLVIANCRGLAHNKTVTSFGKFKTQLFNNSVNAKNLSTRQRPEEPPWRVIFFGTDDFSLSCLQPLNAKLNTGTLLSSLGVVSQENSLVHKFSVSEKLPIYQWPPKEDILNNYDMGVVVSYGKLIPEYIINALPLGVLNVHASLLPRWRGAAPIAYAVMNGDAETGVTIMLIKPHKFDIGDMVRQYRCSIAPNETTLELRARLAKHAAQLLMECIRDIPRCLDNALPQPNDGVTYAPKVSMKLSAVNWEKMTAKRVYDLHRAISYTFPLSTSWFDKPVRLYGIRLTYQPSSEMKTVSNTQSSKSALNFLNDTVSENSEIIGNTDSSPGKINYNRKTKIIKIQCADGKWITCEQFKVSTGRIMTPPDFYNGFLSKKDPKDWFFK